MTNNPVEATKMVECGTLAYRVEGGYWVASYARESNAEMGPLEIARIAFPAVRDFPEIKEQFMDMTKNVIAHLMKENFDAEITWADPVVSGDEDA